MILLDPFPAFDSSQDDIHEITPEKVLELEKEKLQTPEKVLEPESEKLAKSREVQVSQILNSGSA